MIYHRKRKGRSLHNRGCDQSLIRKYFLMNGNGSASAIVPIRVMNTRGYRLPKTGDAGTTLLAAGGITLAVLSAAAVILLLVFKKKISLTIKKA